MAIWPIKTFSPGATKPGPYLPAPHSWHVLNPAVAEYFPAAQSVHTAEPEPALYFPAVHDTHVWPSGAVAPALQVQSVMTSDA
jgi:hypothetical protein